MASPGDLRLAGTEDGGGISHTTATKYTAIIVNHGGESRWVHGGVTVGSRWNHGEPRWDHGRITVESRRDHGGITAGSQWDHGGITAESRWDHGGITAGQSR